MKIVIFGGQGRLGQELLYSLNEEHDVVPLSRFNVDITKFSDVKDILMSLKADIIINAAAVTSIPLKIKEEAAKERIFQVNTVGAVNLAMAAKELNIQLLHISCASVLAGSKDKTLKGSKKALEILGQSKLEAEESIEKLFEGGEKKYGILRTGVLFGAYGHSMLQNFKRMVVRSKEKDVLYGVSDISYSFTPTQLIAEYVLEKLKNNPQDLFQGNIQHVCLQGKASPLEVLKIFAQALNKKVVLKSMLASDSEEVAGDFSLESKEGENLESALLKL